MKRTDNHATPARDGGRGGIVLIWVICVLMAGMGAMTLQAATTTTFGTYLSTGGGPVKGESGWINLPYVRGIVPLDPKDGDPLFRQLRGLRLSRNGKVVSDDLSSGGATLVVEGRDGHLLPALVERGSPQSTVVDLGKGLTKGLLTGPLVVHLDPVIIRPELNTISLSLPLEWLGGVVRVQGDGVEESYGLVDENSLQISWGTMLHLARRGIETLKLEAYSLSGLKLDLVLEAEDGNAEMKISLGM